MGPTIRSTTRLRVSCERAAESGRKVRPGELGMKVRVDGSDDQIDDEAEAQTVLAKDGGDLLAIAQPPTAWIESEETGGLHRVARRRLPAAVTFFSASSSTLRARDPAGVRRQGRPGPSS